MTGDELLDRFLLEHPQEDVYRLGQYRPVSVRDQIVRTCFLVERLWHKKRLQPNSKLLIIGAGAAGVTAAIKSIHFGVQHVMVADSQASVLSLQAGCRTRWVDPAQYDWPATHWSEQRWPIREPRGFTAGTASKMAPPLELEAGWAEAWAAKFEFALNVYELKGQVTFHPCRKAIEWNPSPAGGYEVEFDDTTSGASAGSLNADVIIFAGGLGKERVSAPVVHGKPARFSSVPFWADDTFEAKDFGLSAVKHGVLVSGSGDGALQDFVRLVTGRRSVKGVWKTVESTLDASTRRRLEALWHWEDLAYRTAAFAPGYGTPIDALATLHQRFALLVDEMVADSARWPRIVARLDALIGPARPTHKVFMVLAARGFDGCYPLNRLVALLLLAYIKHRHPGHDPLLVGRAVRSVHPTGLAKPWGEGVLVEFEDPSGMTNTIAFDSVVIRHGIDPSTLSVAARRLALQPVPAHLP